MFQAYVEMISTKSLFFVHFANVAILIQLYWNLHPFNLDQGLVDNILRLVLL